MKRLSVSIFLLLAFTFLGSATNLQANDVKPLANLHNVYITYGIGGTTTPRGTQEVVEGQTLLVSIIPDATYTIKFVRINDVIVELTSPNFTTDADGNTAYLFPPIYANQTIYVEFSPSSEPLYSISSTSGQNGTILPRGTLWYAEGDATEVYVITPDSGYELDELVVNGNLASPTTITPTITYNFGPMVASNQTIEVRFKEAIVHHNITVTIVNGNGVYGSVTMNSTNVPGPAATLSVLEGTDAAFEFTSIPDNQFRYWIDSINIDGEPVANLVQDTKDYQHTFTNVVGTHTVYVAFNSNLSIAEFDIPSLLITPNPVENKATIQKDANVVLTKVEFVNIMGEVVMTINNPNQMLDLASLSTGNYFVRFYTENGYTVRRIVKK